MSEQMTPLPQRMIDDMAIRVMSSLTQDAYIRAFEVQPFLSTVAGQADVRTR